MVVELVYDFSTPPEVFISVKSASALVLSATILLLYLKITLETIAESVLPAVFRTLPGLASIYSYNIVEVGDFLKAI